ncbi:TPM domain-containing protein [soil metagenome]
MFSLFRKKPLFSSEENEKVVRAIRLAELNTNGEVRVFAESRCRFVDPLDRAVEIFAELQMQSTTERNAVLVYVAIKDRQLAVFGDEGIHQKTGEQYWKEQVAKMINAFNKENYAQGIAQCVLDIGLALKLYFPYNKETDKNELPDDIIFGR